jgi:hypothetical protein
VQHGGNAGRHRGLFAVSLGIIVIGIGLIPIILNSLNQNHTWHQRLTRLSSIPALWLGFATVIAGLHGVCVLIFLFGDARQLYPYELRRPNISSPIACYPSLTLNPNLAANAAERKKQQLPGRNSSGATNIELPNRRPTLDNTGISGGRRASTVSVTISPQKERFSHIEVVHLPSRGGGHHRTDTVTASETSATFSPSEGHTDLRHRNSMSKADYESIGNLNFGLYEGDDHSTNKAEYTERVMPADDLEAQPATEMFPRHGGSRYVFSLLFVAGLVLNPHATGMDQLLVHTPRRSTQTSPSRLISMRSLSLRPCVSQTGKLLAPPLLQWIRGIRYLLLALVPPPLLPLCRS